jgi:tRNA 2-thiocytidine biosynthesis protein TtcA
MPPKLVSDDGQHIVIRPLAYVAEKDLARFAEDKQFPIIPCDLCGSQDNLQRQQIKGMLHEWERKHPGRIESMFNSLANVRGSHLLDRGLFDFASLRAQGTPFADGDVAFDQEPLPDQVIPLRRVDAA